MGGMSVRFMARILDLITDRTDLGIHPTQRDHAPGSLTQVFSFVFIGK